MEPELNQQLRFDLETDKIVFESFIAVCTLQARRSKFKPRLIMMYRYLLCCIPNLIWFLYLYFTVKKRQLRPQKLSVFNFINR